MISVAAIEEFSILYTPYSTVVLKFACPAFCYRKRFALFLKKPLYRSADFGIIRADIQVDFYTRDAIVVNNTCCTNRKNSCRTSSADRSSNQHSVEVCHQVGPCVAQSPCVQTQCIGTQMKEINW